MSRLSRAVELTAETAQESAAGLSDALGERRWTVATAESLTGGNIGALLSAAPRASDWFRGSVVAYHPEVKFGLLGVPRGPVVTEECATTMATRTAQLLGADLTVAVTGVGGPEPDEDQAPGTVWFAVASPDGVTTEKVVFGGSPVEVLTSTCEHAIALLHRVAADETATRAGGPPAPRPHRS